VLNISFWNGSSDIYAKWAGVPPVPTRTGALMTTLGDAQFSFRMGALALQQLGDFGGRVTPIKDYDYQKLGGWFWLLDSLDPASDHVPRLAAYYFGVTQSPADAAVLVAYLGTVGNSPVGEKWRWLAQAAYLARYKMHDLGLALDLAYKLSKLQPVSGELPGWARQMPAFVLKEQGDKEASRQMMETILATEKNLPWQEVNSIKFYLIEQLGVPEEEVNALIKMRGDMPEKMYTSSPLEKQ
jgi:hypothetical protein